MHGELYRLHSKTIIKFCVIIPICCTCTISYLYGPHFMGPFFLIPNSKPPLVVMATGTASFITTQKHIYAIITILDFWMPSPLLHPLINSFSLLHHFNSMSLAPYKYFHYVLFSDQGNPQLILNRHSFDSSIDGHFQVWYALLNMRNLLFGALDIIYR